MFQAGRRLATFAINVQNRFLMASQLETACATCYVKQSPVVTLPLPALKPFKVPQRQQHTRTSNTLENMSSWQKIKWDMGFYGKLQVPNKKLKISGYNLYICCTDFVDFELFIKELNLPDTFNSWFVLLQLHMWLVNVKLSQMGKEGELLKRYFYISLWHDVEKRLQTYEDLVGSEKRKSLEGYYSLMILSIMYYDEGLLGSDKILANALWLQLFGMDENVKAEKLDLMVEYVRKQVFHLDHVETQPIMYPGFVSFLPLFGEKLDQAVTERNFKLIQSY